MRLYFIFHCNCKVYPTGAKHSVHVSEQQQFSASKIIIVLSNTALALLQQNRATALLPSSHMRTHTHTPNQSNSNTYFQYGFKGFGHIQSQSTKKTLKRKYEIKQLKSVSLSSSLCGSFSTLFPSLSCCNWLYHEMKVTNAVLSLVVSASDWVQHSPNYQKNTSALTHNSLS